MPFETPKLSVAREAIFRDFQARLPEHSLLRQSNIGVTADVFAGLMDAQYGFLDWIARQVIPDTADAEFLERWAAIWDIARLPAARAVGAVDLTGTDGVSVPIGTELTRADGQLIRTTGEGVLAGGTLRLAVEALEAGAEGNAAAGAEYRLQEAVPGLDALAVTPDGLTGGMAAEGDAALRARLLDRIALPPHGGARHDYETWAREVDGVTRVWVRPGWLGIGTVGIAVAVDPAANGGSPIPSDHLVADVAAYIDPLRPVTAEVTVFKPVPLPVDVTVQALDPDTPLVRQAVEAELADLFARDGALGAILPLSKLWEAVSLATGERSHRIAEPVVDVAPQAHELPVLGVVSYG